MSLFQSRTTYLDLALDVATEFQSSILSDNAGGACVQTKGQDDARKFDGLLVESLDESVGLVLGEIGRKAVYEVLEKNYAIARNRMPERLNELTLAFDAMFGAASSKVVVRAIVKRLYSKLGLTFVEIPDWRLPDYVREARARMTLYNERKPWELPVRV